MVMVTPNMLYFRFQKVLNIYFFRFQEPYDRLFNFKILWFKIQFMFTETLPNRLKEQKTNTQDELTP